MHYAPPLGLRIRGDDPLLPIMMLVYMALKALLKHRPLPG